MKVTKTSSGFISLSAELLNLEDGKEYEINIVTEKSRTNLQSACLHSYLGQIAKKLNEAGYDFKEVVKLPVSFTTDNVKLNMFHPVMKAMYPHINSTTGLSTIQLQEVYEVFNAAMAERLSVSGMFPDRFNGGKI